MEGADPVSQSRSIDGVDVEETQEIASHTLERGSGSKSSKSSNGSSQYGQQSPTLSPSQSHPMTNSTISNLDLDLDEASKGTGRSESRLMEDVPSAQGTMGANGRVTPITPSHVLDPPISLPRATLPTVSESVDRNSTSMEANGSTLDALMDAHEKQEYSPSLAESSNSSKELPKSSSTNQEHSFNPHTKDASFGLDPDADTTHSLEGTPFRPVHSSLHHHHHQNGQSSNSKSIYDSEELSAPSHTTAATGAPETMKTNMLHTQTVPTASATGMPRLWPRRTSRSPSHSSLSSSSSSMHKEEPHAPNEMMPQYPPSGSLTLAIFSRNISWQRRGYLLLASIAINLGLPFINGVMLGFGEIFARSIVAPYIGLAPASININAPGPRAAGTSGAGLRYAGVGESQGTGGKRVSVESWEIEPGQKRRTV